MFTFYGRRAQIIVGDDHAGIQIPADVTLGALKIEFQIRRALTGDKPKDNFISVYNLSDATQSFISSRGQRIRLYAGYTDTPPIIFDGQIKTIDNGRHRIDSITKMTLGDGVYNVTNAVFSKSYNSIVDVKTILSDAVASFGLSAVGLSSLPDNQLNNFAYDGPTKTLFTELLSPIGYDWYIDNGMIRFSQRGAPRQDLDVVLLNENTGMIDSPRKTEKGINVTSLLNNNLRLGGKVKIESKTLDNAGNGRESNQLSYSVSGFYKINEITHRGNNWDDQMITEILAVSL